MVIYNYLQDKFSPRQSTFHLGAVTPGYWQEKLGGRSAFQTTPALNASLGQTDVTRDLTSVSRHHHIPVINSWRTHPLSKRRFGKLYLSARWVSLHLNILSHSVFISYGAYKLLLNFAFGDCLTTILSSTPITWNIQLKMPFLCNSTDQYNCLMPPENICVLVSMCSFQILNF